MQQHRYPTFLLFMILTASTYAQDMASAAFSGPEDPIKVHIQTQLHDAWEFSGNIIIGNTSWSGPSEETGMTFHNLETMNEVLAEELDRMKMPEVALAQFSASVNEGQVNIDWTSMITEKKIMAFYVQRSYDGTDWNDIGMFTTKDRTEVLAPYAFVDNHPMQGSNFYRLRQVDEDEQPHYSDVIAVEVMKMGYHVTHIFPTPIVFGANIEVELFRPSTVDIQLYDEAGNGIGTIYSDLTSIGRHQIEINLDQLPRGLYTCEIKVGTSTSKRTLIK